LRCDWRRSLAEAIFCMDNDGRLARAWERESAVSTARLGSSSSLLLLSFIYAPSCSSMLLLLAHEVKEEEDYRMAHKV
jgi:hypothetical protein